MKGEMELCELVQEMKSEQFAVVAVAVAGVAGVEKVEVASKVEEAGEEEWGDLMIREMVSLLSHASKSWEGLMEWRVG